MCFTDPLLTAQTRGYGLCLDDLFSYINQHKAVDRAGAWNMFFLNKQMKKMNEMYMIKGL